MKLANRRIRLVLAVFAVAFAAMFARAAWLQGVRAGSFERLADGQHRATLVDPGGRGGIYDRTGVQLAIGRQATSVYANPRQVRDPEALAAVVGHALRVDPAEMQQLLSDRSRGFVYLVRKADPTRAAVLKRMGIVGLGFIPEEKRVYPLNHVAAQVVGYAGTDNHGLAGVELGLERKLSGKPGSETVVRDPSGRAISVLESTAGHEGQDVYLTIDHTIQAQAEAVLRSTLDRWRAKSASAIVLDPRTGDILAMAVERGYDANQFPIIPRDLQRNRAVTDTYEPGSTFKVVTVSAVLSEGRVTPRTRAAPSGCTWTRSSRNRRTWARSRSPRSSARSVYRSGSGASASGTGRASTSPARARASSRRLRAGRARRSGRCRSVTAWR